LVLNTQQVHQLISMVVWYKKRFMKYEDQDKNISIIADSIEIGENVYFGKNISIRLKGKFSLGNYSRLGNNTEIFGNNVYLGEHLFHSSGLRIGGGGRQHPNADIQIGDRCTIHNNFLNICEPIFIGNDVGLSPETSILTHGYWLSVLEGYPASFTGVKIGNGVIVGYRSLIMMGVEVADYCVIGAQSVVTKSLKTKGIYAGSPAKFIKEIVPLTTEERILKTEHIISEYKKIAKYHNLDPSIQVDFPWVTIENFRVNFETMDYDGDETIVTDDFRDYIRKWGIRIYTKRPFISNFQF
jgi:acetyltransferase-like isoleucine patch superfamily enzyme